MEEKYYHNHMCNITKDKITKLNLNPTYVRRS
jgi:hypothetical protein